VQSFEPGEDWFWHYGESSYYNGPELAPPVQRPDEQPVPGGNVPDDWQSKLHR
jgi:hypothetical protein